jgi:predicted Zn-ribbon and HTH transcriptional regulator
VEPVMKKIPNSSRHPKEHILRALNQIRKPSTAGEITELLNRDLDREDSPFQAKDVAEWLRKTDDMALTLYWSRTRPRK